MTITVKQWSIYLFFINISHISQVADGTNSGDVSGQLDLDDIDNTTTNFTIYLQVHVRVSP